MAYLTAKEAGKIAEDTKAIDGSFMRADTDRIMEEIEKLARCGELKMTASFGLHKVIQDRLKQLGYSVKVTSDQRDGDWTTISW